VISVQNISKKFKEHTVLDQISLECYPGKIYGFVGYNGSGKTVLFKCICGLFLVDSGSIVIDGKTVGEEMIKNAGIIIEEPAFIRNETGRRNLEFLYMLNHKRDPAVITEVMNKVGLDPDSKKKVKEYSLGMRQRLAIAQAIMENPDILILDEPMNGLDKDGVREVRQILLQLKDEGKTILLASHNKDDIAILCDQVYEMDRGKCIELDGVQISNKNQI
jgi:ABC-2 type transport system ATP-binding protein